VETLGRRNCKHLYYNYNGQRGRKKMKARDIIYEVIDAVLCDIEDIDKHICPVRLLQMPNRESLESLGDAWLAPADAFSQEELVAAERAGGKVIDGYSFPYSRSIAINRYLLRRYAAGEVADGGWCGYKVLGAGYALQRGIALAVCAASIAQGGAE